jgi:hypothetical protein
MSAIRGLAHRPQNVPTVLLQGRVSPETRLEVRAAAAASGVSIAYYMEALVAQIVAEQGCLPWSSTPRQEARGVAYPGCLNERARRFRDGLSQDRCSNPVIRQDSWV